MRDIPQERCSRWRSLPENPGVERFIIATASPNDQYAGPGFRDWMLFGIGVIPVLCGLIGLLFNPSNPNVGIVTITFFGLCTATSAVNIIRKLRFCRPRPLRVEIVGGVPIRPSRVYYFIIGAAITVLGAVIIVFGREYPEPFWFMGWPLVIVGCLILSGLAIGRLPIGHLQFDPPGITISRGRWAYTIPWDGIAKIDRRELSDHHAVLLIWPHHEDVVSVHPQECKGRLTRHFAWNLHWAGAPIVILPSQYGMDLPLLIQAVDRYITVPSTRTELSSRLLE
jgi:hypothetical protein